MDVAGEEVHGQRQLRKGEVRADVVDQVCQDAVRQGPGEGGRDVG